MISEKLTIIMHHELPYVIAVETEAWNQLKDGSIRIDALIYVQKKGQKKIVIGANGDNLKSIGINCRKELKSMLNKDVHLVLGMMKDKDHQKYVNVFKNKIKSLTLIDIPNQEGSISKEEFKLKIQKNISGVKISKSIEEAIKLNSNSSDKIILIAGSLYLAGEVLNLN